jgi:hypothetical protein
MITNVKPDFASVKYPIYVCIIHIITTFADDNCVKNVITWVKILLKRLRSPVM